MPREIAFTKAHSLHNDFVIVETSDLSYLSAQQIASLANRHTGIGCDQVLGLKKCGEQHYHYSIYNADGTEAQQCINGMRAIAHMLLLQHPDISTLTLDNPSGSFQATRQPDDQIALYIPAHVTEDSHRIIHYAGCEYPVRYLTCGNPHALVAVPCIDNPYPLSDLAACVEASGPNTGGYNVSIYAEKGAQQWVSRTHERGAGETQACGSAAIALAIHHGTKDILTIEQKGGIQRIRAHNSDTLEIIAPAAISFTGTIPISD
jgi:diaminopimelate epimerase